MRLHKRCKIVQPEMGSLHNRFFQLFALVFQIAQVAQVAPLPMCFGLRVGIGEVNHGDVLAPRDLGKIPAQGAIDAQQIDHGGALVDTVEHEKDAVLEGACRQGVAQAGVYFAHGAGLVGIEQHQYQIGDLRQIADDFLVIVSAVPLRNAVEHTGRVDNGQML
jgi:hypothetical protein